MLSKKRILVTARIHDEVSEHLKAFADLDINLGVEPWSRAEIIERASSCDAVMAFMTDHLDGDFFTAAPSIRFVACALKGYDNIDVAAAARCGAGVSIVPDLLTDPTAELAIALAIALARHIPRGDALVRSGAFSGWRPILYGRGLAGSAVAVFGLGRVGRAIIDRLQGFGCARIYGVDPFSRDDRTIAASAGEAVRDADYIFVALPLVPGTRNFINADLLAGARKTPLVINVGRGSVVDEDAIAKALADGRITGYAADVFAFEDWALPDRPRSIPQALLDHPASLFTPHLGSAVSEVRLAIEMRAANNLIDWIECRPSRDLLAPLG